MFSASTPRWQKWLIATILVATFLTVLYIARASQSGFATLDAQVDSSDRRDCITTIATARNAVFQNVDIFKAEAQTLIFNALLDLRQNGTAAVPDETVAAIDQANRELDVALAEARRLQPPEKLDELIAHGGVIAGKHYPACIKVG